jgi:hypothetical protein
MKYFNKHYYKPRFKGYYLLRSSIDILSGIIDLFSSLVGYDCVIAIRYAEYNLKTDMQLRMKNRKLK